MGWLPRLQLWGYSRGRLRSELPGRPDNSLINSFRLRNHISYWTKSSQGHRFPASLSTSTYPWNLPAFVVWGKTWAVSVPNTPSTAYWRGRGSSFSPSATGFEIGLVWKSLRIYFLAPTSKLRWRLDLELQGLHVYYYYKVRASWPRVYKCPVTSNLLA